MYADRKCFICGKNEVQHLGEIVFLENFNSLPSTHKIVFCKHCGNIYADIKATQKDFDNYYQCDSTYGNNFSFGGSLKKEDITHFNSIINFISDNISPSMSIMDMGCAKGGLLKTLKQKGYNNLTGIEPSKLSFKVLKENDINCFNGDVFIDKQELDNKFDLITMSHVIEHVYDIEKALLNIKRMLKEDGLLYIEAPDASKYYDCYKTPYHFFSYEHISHFSKFTLSNLMTKYGFEIVKAGEIDCLWPSIGILCRKTKKNLRIQTNNEEKNKFKKYMTKYIKKSEKEIQNGAIGQLIRNKEKVIIWGIGASTASLLNKGLSHCNITGIVDSDPNKIGKSILGHKIIAPKIIAPSDIKDTKSSILILPLIYQKDIETQIKNFGYENKILTL